MCNMYLVILTLSTYFWVVYPNHLSQFFIKCIVGGTTLTIDPPTQGSNCNSCFIWLKVIFAFLDANK